MQKKKFDKILSQTKNQLLILIKEERFYLNLQKELVLNDLGVIAINERTGSASIVFFDDINAIISDGEKHDE